MRDLLNMHEIGVPSAGTKSNDLIARACERVCSPVYSCLKYYYMASSASGQEESNPAL